MVLIILVREINKLTLQNPWHFGEQVGISLIKKTGILMAKTNLLAKILVQINRWQEFLSKSSYFHGRCHSEFNLHL